MRIVIDTNILLSIYLYRDARHIPLRERYICGADVLLMDAVCYEELAHVLRHRQFEDVRVKNGIDFCCSPRGGGPMRSRATIKRC
jgi:predicted nucleic acid-binding protein